MATRMLRLLLAVLLGVAFTGCGEDSTRLNLVGGDVLVPVVPPRVECMFPTAAELEVMRQSADVVLRGTVQSQSTTSPYPPIGQEPAGLSPEQVLALQRGVQIKSRLLVEEVIKESGVAVGQVITIGIVSPGPRAGDYPYFLEVGRPYILFLLHGTGDYYWAERVVNSRFVIEDGSVRKYCSLRPGRIPASGVGQGQAVGAFIAALAG